MIACLDVGARVREEGGPRGCDDVCGSSVERSPSAGYGSFVSCRQMVLQEVLLTLSLMDGQVTVQALSG